jgi:hypothetical protein
MCFWAMATRTDAPTYTLVHYDRPWTLNVERQGGHWSARSKLVSAWRSTFAMLAKAEKLPPMEAVRIEALQTIKGRKNRPDTAACIGAVKAAIDGLVDARVLVDDTPDIVKYLGFYAPVSGDRDSLTLYVTPVMP